MDNLFKFSLSGIRTSLIILIIVIQQTTVYAQEARVVTFNHTIRWLNESNFPNYFLMTEVRDSINNEIRQNLMLKFKVNKVTFPEKVEYCIITGFGKPKNIPGNPVNSLDYTIDLFSFLTRATAGNAVFWSVNIVIRKDGNVILDKEVKHEIENSNSAAYMSSLRWFPPHEFKKILMGMVNEALGLTSETTDKIVVGGIEAKEQEVLSWFPNAKTCVLKMNGSWLSSGNFSAQLQNGIDTLVQSVYKNSPVLETNRISFKPVLANLFKDVTGIGTTYTITEKERRRGVLEFQKGGKLGLELEWFEDITYSTNSDRVESRITVPLVGQLFDDKVPVGSFVYERVSQVLTTSKTEEKFSWASGSYTKNSFGTALIHRIRGTLNNIPFNAEYNELFGFMEIKLNNQTQAVMIFQNCNPENLRSFSKSKISKNKLFISGGSTNIGTPSLNNQSKTEWYPFLIRENATSEVLISDIEILVCLFFGIGNM